MTKAPQRRKSTIKKFEMFVKSVLRTIQKNYKHLNTPKHRAWAYMAVLIFSIVLLLITSTYAGYHASNAYSTDSNAIITTQQFSGSIHYPVTLPGPHATLIVLPLVYIQGHLPYHYASFTVLNVGLVLLTMVAWAFLLIKLFGRRYEIPILILLSSLIFTSVIFSLTLGYDTIRNIEYPIVLWFVLIVSRLLSGKKYTRRELVFASIGNLLFIVTLAGDSFFNYAILLPLLAVIVWYWAQSRQFTLNMLKAVGLIAGVVIGSHLLKLILTKTGLIFFNYAFWGQNSIIPTISLAPSLSIALKQLMDLQGGNIFGQIVNSHNLTVFLNFGLLIASMVGLIIIIAKANRSYRSKKEITNDDSFVLATVAVSYFVVFLIYVLSGYVITTLPDGQIISVVNTRYISLLPLLSTIGIIWLLKNYYSKHKAFLGAICIVLLMGIATSYHGISLAYNSGTQLELAPSRTSIDQINNILKTNNVHEVVSDYWYGPVLRFWSNDSINLAQTSGCSLPLTATADKEGKFTRRKGVNSAVVIDRGGLNYAYWACSDDQIAQVYGNPTKKLEVPGVTPTPVEIWIYNPE